MPERKERKERTLLRIPTRVAYLAPDKADPPAFPIWWIRFEGSQERMMIGPNRPDLNVGDVVFIDIVKP